MLTSPSGVISHLGTARPGDDGADFSGWRFRSVRHWGEPAAGAWKITVVDRAEGSTGTFSGWTLRLYGIAAAADPTVPTTHQHGDFDGDGKADIIGLFARPTATGSSIGSTTSATGIHGDDIPVAAT